jgi:hypothetical protein
MTVHQLDEKRPNGPVVQQHQVDVGSLAPLHHDLPDKRPVTLCCHALRFSQYRRRGVPTHAYGDTMNLPVGSLDTNMVRAADYPAFLATLRVCGLVVTSSSPGSPR